MIYSIEELKELIEPIAIRFKLKALWVFGSYARGEATEKSDIDFLIDDKDFNLPSLYDLVNLFNELKLILNKNIDLITTDSLFSPRMKKFDPEFIDIVIKERIILYSKP
jgi:predicted nucleotidyltransferase